MPKFGRKKSLSDHLYSKPVIAVLVVITGFLAVSVFERYQVEREMSARRITAEAEYQALLEREASLKEQVEYLSGERGIEEEIRKHFDVAREGEQVIILLGEDEPSASEISPEPTRKKWYQFWLKP